MNSIEQFFSALSNPNIPFIRYALIAGIISSISFGVIGSFVVVKRMSYVAGAVSHAVLGGIGLALFMNATWNFTMFTPMAGALVFALLNGLIISFTLLYSTQRLDSVIGTLWALGMSIGLLFMSITPQYVDPMSYLFGNILLITRGDLILISILNVIILAISLLFYNQFLTISFDEEFAHIRGINVAFYQTLLILLISVTVLLMVTIVGIVMVIAFLTIPPAIAGMFSKKLKSMIVISIPLCAFFMIIGIAISYMAELPTSSVTIIITGSVYFLVIVGKMVFKK